MQVLNIENETINNDNFRKVLITTENIQVVVMSLNVGEKIDKETHDISDQFFRVEQGSCQILINDVVHTLNTNDIFVVPKKTLHEVVNTGNTKLKLYTIYTPPHHPPNTIHQTKRDEDLSDIETYKRKIQKYTTKLNNLTEKNKNI